MLEKMRMSIKGFYVKEAVVYVIVQTYLKRGGPRSRILNKRIPQLVYMNAEERAQEYVSLFRDLIKIDSNNIIVLKN